MIVTLFNETYLHSCQILAYQDLIRPYILSRFSISRESYNE
jgi:hypothetical protein